MTRPTIDTAERRRRLAVRHHLAPPCRATDLVALADDLVGIHATDPASVYLGIHARTRSLTRDSIASALYDDRNVLRILGMRRTMFVASRVNSGVIQSAVSRKLGEAERRRLVRWLDESGVLGDHEAEGWLADVESQTMAVLGELREATATELTKRVPGLRVQIPVSEGKRYAGQVGVSTRMLFLLATEGRIVRGRPRGTWLSSMYAWSPIKAWVPGGLPSLPVEDAQAELVRRYLAAFGPATLRDVQWWTGWTVRDTKRAVAAVEAVEVDVESETVAAFALPGDLEATPDSGPWVALLPALDTTTMAWADRDWYLGEHRARLFDTNGNAGPTIWCDGRVVGGWAQRTSGEIVHRFFEDVGSEAAAAVEAEAARIAAFVGESRIIPRFRTPTEVEMQ